MDYFNLLTFLLLIISTAVSVGLLFSIGHRLVGPIIAHQPKSLIFAVSLFSGMLAFIFLMNILSYLVTPSLATWIITAVCVITTIWYARSQRHLFSIQSINQLVRKRETQLIGGTLLVLYVLFFINGLYDVFIFDEVFHRPVISSIVAGNFPILNPTNPLELTTHYNYHYGIYLLAAALVTVTHMSNTIVLDIVSSITFIGTFFLFLGLANIFLRSTKHAITTTILGLMSGGFAFIVTDNIDRAAFFSNDYMPFLYSGYAPLFHLLYPITFVYIPLTIVFLILLQHIVRQASRFNLWFTYIFPALLLASFALVGEAGFLVLIPTLLVFYALKWLLDTPGDRKAIIRGCSRVAIIFIIALSIAAVQGGVITGMAMGPIGQQDSIQRAKEVAEAFSINPPAVIHTSEGKTVLFFQFIKPINRIFASENTKILLSELGIFILFFVPLTGWFLIHSWSARKASDTTNELFLLLTLFAIITGLFLPTFFSSGKIDDVYLTKFFSLSTSILPFLVLILLQKKQHSFHTALYHGIILLFVLACVPNLFLKSHFNWYYKHVSDSIASYNPADYPQIDRNLLKNTHITTRTIALTSETESWMVSDLSGILTYSDLLKSSESLQRRVLQDVNPDDLARLGITHVYLTPTLMAQLSAVGRSNISSYFDIIAQERTDHDWRMLLKLRTIY